MFLRIDELIRPWCCIFREYFLWADLYHYKLVVYSYPFFEGFFIGDLRKTFGFYLSVVILRLHWWEIALIPFREFYHNFFLAFTIHMFSCLYFPSTNGCKTAFDQSLYVFSTGWKLSLEFRYSTILAVRDISLLLNQNGF